MPPRRRAVQAYEPFDNQVVQRRRWLRPVGAGATTVLGLLANMIKDELYGTSWLMGPDYGRREGDTGIMGVVRDFTNHWGTILNDLINRRPLTAYAQFSSRRPRIVDDSLRRAPQLLMLQRTGDPRWSDTRQAQANYAGQIVQTQRPRSFEAAFRRWMCQGTTFNDDIRMGLGGCTLADLRWAQYADYMNQYRNFGQPWTPQTYTGMANKALLVGGHVAGYLQDWNRDFFYPLVVQHRLATVLPTLRAIARSVPNLITQIPLLRNTPYGAYARRHAAPMPRVALAFNFWKHGTYNPLRPLYDWTYWYDRRGYVINELDASESTGISQSAIDQLRVAEQRRPLLN